MSESAKEIPARRVPEKSAVTSPHCENTTRSKRHPSKKPPRSCAPAKRTLRSREREKLTNSPLQCPNTTCCSVVSANPAPAILHSSNRTRKKLAPCRSATDRSQFRKRTSVKREPRNTAPPSRHPEKRHPCTERRLQSSDGSATPRNERPSISPSGTNTAGPAGAPDSGGSRGGAIAGDADCSIRPQR